MKEETIPEDEEKQHPLFAERSEAKTKAKARPKAGIKPRMLSEDDMEYDSEGDLIPTLTDSETEDEDNKKHDMLDSATDGDTSDEEVASPEAATKMIQAVQKSVYTMRKEREKQRKRDWKMKRKRG